MAATLTLAAGKGLIHKRLVSKSKDADPSRQYAFDLNGLPEGVTLESLGQAIIDALAIGLPSAPGGVDPGHFEELVNSIAKRPTYRQVTAAAEARFDNVTRPKLRQLEAEAFAAGAVVREYLAKVRVEANTFAPGEAEPWAPDIAGKTADQRWGRSYKPGEQIHWYDISHLFPSKDGWGPRHDLTREEFCRQAQEWIDETGGVTLPFTKESVWEAL